jgi:dynein heavy chain, axonemal
MKWNIDKQNNIYGIDISISGRVTDDFDKRLLKTYVKCWFRDEMFDPNFQFEDKIYRIPKMTRIEDVLEYIDTMPNYDSGKVFGLSPLANDR